MARKFGANCSKCQRSTEQQQSIKCFKIHSKDLLQNNDFHITSSIFLLSSVLVFYFFLILFFNSIVYRFFIARIFGVLPEYFRDWGGCRPPRPPGSYAYMTSLDTPTSCKLSNRIAYKKSPTTHATVLRTVIKRLNLNGKATSAYCAKVNAKTMKKDLFIVMAAIVPATSSICDLCLGGYCRTGSSMLSSLAQE